MKSKLLQFLVRGGAAAVVTTAVAAAPLGVQDHTDSCNGCLLGLWDDQAMTQNYGTILPGETKSLYLGIKYDPSFPDKDLVAVEFSIAGVRFEEDGIVVLNTEGVVPETSRSGQTPQAPADTSLSSTGNGGVIMIWTNDLVGNQAVVRIDITTTQVLENAVLRVKRMYPTSNPVEWPFSPVIVHRRFPVFTITRVVGGCYVLNPQPVGNTDCDILTDVHATTWGNIKGMFR